MSSSPRSAPSQTALFALAVGAALIGCVILLRWDDLLEEGQEFITGLSPIAVTTEGAEIRKLTRSCS